MSGNLKPKTNFSLPSLSKPPEVVLYGGAAASGLRWSSDGRQTLLENAELHSLIGRISRPNDPNFKGQGTQNGNWRFGF
ncbi:hypothetical protein COLO4_06575 [Corchorus olitorius]|uniref:Uncharacterized protein n=1 Tax=Corchorus olitorius TaxID=93759 RepID=A0A1R3KMP3_9ROSI|nr:hypothetical protein COLO4_06575 [Corchorus olitorius]